LSTQTHFEKKVDGDKLSPVWTSRDDYAETVG